MVTDKRESKHRTWGIGQARDESSKPARVSHMRNIIVDLAAVVHTE